jgi:phosphoheptose isomerase
MTLLERALAAAVAAMRGLTSGRKLPVCGKGSRAAAAARLATTFLRRYRPDRRPCPAAYGR